MHLLNLHNLTVKEIPALELAPIAVHEIVIEVLFGALDPQKLKEGHVSPPTWEELEKRFTTLEKKQEDLTKSVNEDQLLWHICIRRFYGELNFWNALLPWSRKPLPEGLEAAPVKRPQQMDDCLLTLLASPIVIHLLFKFTDFFNRSTQLFHRMILRIIVFLGASIWLTKASLKTNFEATTSALRLHMAESFQQMRMQHWLAWKLSTFIISVSTGLSRTTLALAAVNFGVRVLPDTWTWDLTTSDPYLKLLDADGNGELTAQEVFDFVFSISNRIWQVCMTSLLGFCLLRLLKPPSDQIPWSEVKGRKSRSKNAPKSADGNDVPSTSAQSVPLPPMCQALSRVVFAMQNPRNAELRILARRAAMASRFIDFLIIMAFFVWPWTFLFGLRPRLIFAFGGVGGLAVGLAARNVVGNLIASFLIQLNRPFVEGDEIEHASKNLIGVVEEIGIINTHVNSRDGVLVHVPNTTLLDDVVVNMSMRDFRTILESVYLVPDSVESLSQLVEDIQHRLDTFEGLLQEEDVQRLLRLRGGRIKLFRPLCMFDGYCDLGLKLTIYAFAKGSLSRRDFQHLKSRLMLSVHDIVLSQGVQIGQLATSDVRRRRKTTNVAPKQRSSEKSSEGNDDLFS
ncbi:unnamed protein product [Durusdinium trenchii]|uniref:Mechanosensitive ion channel MscS domain-containing protein n=1 Tax=Durusdinium trenchii TaxID=1381693 RepID=A0ABP0HIP1_9DINO